MATNPYKQRQGFQVESDFIQKLTTEAIKWGGLDLYYIPRTLNKLDRIFGEDTLSSFEVALPIEMYLEDVSGYSGEDAIISKFGLEIRDNATLVVSRERFEEAIKPFLPASREQKITVRPLEGDLIYDELTRSLFEIRFVIDEDPFYQTGKRFVWKFSVEKFQYNSEKFATGNVVIDDLFGDKLNDNRLDSGFVTEASGDQLVLEDGGYIIQEVYDEDYEEVQKDVLTYGENSEFKKEFLEIRDFSEDNPFGDGY